MFMSLQCSRPASCWGQLCFSSCCAAHSTWLQTRTRRSWQSGSSGRTAMASPTMMRWDWPTSENKQHHKVHVCLISHEPFCHVLFFLSCVLFFEQDDIQRRIIWEKNKRIIEDNNQEFFMGMRPFTMAMNKYGDLVSWTVFLSILIASKSHKAAC